MTESDDPPPPLDDFGPSGAAIWGSVTGAWELDAHELRLLVQICRTADTLDRLAELVARDGLITKARNGEERLHPAAVESRQLSVTYARLCGALQLPAGDEESAGRGQKPGVRGVYSIKGGKS